MQRAAPQESQETASQEQERVTLEPEPIPCSSRDREESMEPVARPASQENESRPIIQMVDARQMQENLMGRMEERLDRMEREMTVSSKKLSKRVKRKLERSTKNLVNRENREQYDFAIGLLEQVEELESLRERGEYGRKMKNTLLDMKDDIENRIKNILTADSSEFGWDTVQELKKRDLVEDSDEEKKIRMAENRVKRARLSRGGGSQGQYKFRPRAPSATFTQPQQHIVTNATGGPIALPVTPMMPSNQLFRPSTGAFRPRYQTISNQYRYPVPRDICLSCGESGHWSFQCPSRNQTQGFQ